MGRTRYRASRAELFSIGRAAIPCLFGTDSQVKKEPSLSFNMGSPDHATPASVNAHLSQDNHVSSAGASSSLGRGANGASTTGSVGTSSLNGGGDVSAGMKRISKEGGVIEGNVTCHGHTRPIVNLHCSPETPDGIFVASASKDGQPQLRDGATGDWIGTFQGHKGAVWSCVLNDSAFVAATGSADFSARVWNAVTGDEVCMFPHKHIVRTTAFERGTSGAHRLMTGGAEKIVRLFDLRGGGDQDPMMTFGPAPDMIRKCMWSMDNRCILLSYLDEKGVDVIDLASGQIVQRIEDSPSGAVLSMEYTHCGKYLVTAVEHLVTIRDAATLQVKASFPIEDYCVEAASYCPERNLLVAGGSDMWVHVYDATTGELLDNGRGHHGPVHCMSFSPRNDSFVSGSEDGTIRIWKL